MVSHPDYPRTRLFLESPLQANATISLHKDHAHYLHQVLRLKTGDAVAVFNGKDGEWLSHITYTEKSSAGLKIAKLLRAQKPSPDAWLLFAPLKGGKTEFIVEKATELGISKILPVYTKHTIVTRLNGERLGKLAIEAAEQCERTDVPEVTDAEKLENLLSKWDKSRALFFCDESGKSDSPSITLQKQKTPCAVLIGPEGGFSAAELDLLRSLPYTHGLSLGPRILKADTAVITALSCVMLHLGDWSEKPAFRAQN